MIAKSIKRRREKCLALFAILLRSDGTASAFIASSFRDTVVVEWAPRLIVAAASGSLCVMDFIWLLRAGVSASSLYAPRHHRLTPEQEVLLLLWVARIK